MEYQKDLIAERDDYVRLHSSVVKWWNDKNAIAEYNAKVQAAQEEMMAQMQAAEAAAAGADDGPSEDDFNATTGTYSGAYGKNASKMNEDEKNQVSDILKQNDSIQDLLNSMN